MARPGKLARGIASAVNPKLRFNTKPVAGLAPDIRRQAKPRHEAPRPTPADNAKQHFTRRDLDAARRELQGEVVARKPNGVPWDHVTEVQETQRRMTKHIQALDKELSAPRLSDADRSRILAERAEASRLLDHSLTYVPRHSRRGG